MEILSWIIIAIVILIFALFPYIWRHKIYKKNQSRNTIKWYQYVGVALICVVVLVVGFVGFLHLNNDIGISESKIEADIRTSQNINAEWVIEGTVSDTMAAFISYPQDQSGHIFSVYINRPGLSIGYFFRDGGTIETVEKSIMEFTFDGYDECAFISMNTQNVARLEIGDGQEIQTINIDNEKPFAIVVPAYTETITFYDAQGNIVEYEKDIFVS